MHVTKLLHKMVGKSCRIDKRLLRVLFEAAGTVAHSRILSVFGIARSLPRKTTVKHSIKTIDRLFGNTLLHGKRNIFYRAMINLLLNNNTRPIIIIDWSGLTRCGTYHFLRAGIAVGGRTLTLYEEAYHESEYAKYKTHKQFLLLLKSILPSSCCPIIVTDAGFSNTWFRLVLKLGWDFIGRCRHVTQYKNSAGCWISIKSLYDKANYKAKFIGEFLLAKSNPLSCCFYLVKQKKKYRTKRNLAGKKIRCSVSLKHAKCGNEPWLIVSSLSPKNISANLVINIYKKRMQIEEAFRDLKNTKNGFGLRHCRSFSKDRLNIALLIGALAMFALWIIGTATKQKNLHYGFQSNIVRKYNVLSNFTIAWQVLERKIHFTDSELFAALQEMILCVSG